jgi:sulfite reductase alpha subunit-like flavoprotein
MSRPHERTTSLQSPRPLILPTSVADTPGGSSGAAAGPCVQRQLKRGSQKAARPPSCREVLRQAERRAAASGHENEGFLSWADGFIPRVAPLHALSPRFAAWDQLAAELPQSYRDLSLRRRVDALPVLDASADFLDERELLRACALMAITAQAYWNVEVRPPEQLPPSVAAPWAELRRRLGRSQEVLSYIDLIVYNWRVVDATRQDPLTVENLRLLIPTVDNREEHVFYLTQVEILARCAPIVRLVTSAQDAVLLGDEDALEEALLGVISCLRKVVCMSLPKINPNANGATFVDPVIWAKTVAPFAVPIHAGDQGPSGTSSPIFNTLDLFFGRKDYASFLGREIRQLRATYPVNWRDFLQALTGVSVGDFIERSGSASLRGAWREAFELYVGQNGFLGRHRMKVYGFLELAFKVGRSVTIGGFGGVFKDRTWDQIDNELEAARGERQRVLPVTCGEARIQRPGDGAKGEPSPVRHLTLDVSRAAVRYGAGDRCAILPENDPQLVDRTSRALGASGNELIRLTDEWKAAGQMRRELAGAKALPLRDVLRYGCIRPVIPRVAEALHARTQNGALLDQIRRRQTERWELWELLDVLRADGLDPTSLWREVGVAASELLCRVIPPQRSRLYSVASATASPLGKPASSLSLVVGQLTYSATDNAASAVLEPLRLPAEPRGGISQPPESAAAGAGSGCPMLAPERFARSTPRPLTAASGCPMHGSRPAHGDARVDTLRQGTASSFLARAAREQTTIPFQIERPARFQPPRDPRAPIIFFAGGTGVAPFLSFLDERRRMPKAGPCWLFWSLRTREDLVGTAAIEAALRVGGLEVDACFTREEAELGTDASGALQVRPGASRRIDQLLLEPSVGGRLWQLLQTSELEGAAASFYVCGRSGFARSVIDSLRHLFQRSEVGDEQQRSARADQVLHRLVANDRLSFEVHTDAQPASEEPRWLDASEVAAHNDAQSGYWMIIDRVVYDVTQFADLHPGGRRVVEAYSGMDATHGYARAHHQRPEVDAMREMYRIGMLRALDFDDHTTEVVGPSGPVTVSCRTAHHAWVQALHLCVEMQNALRMDYDLQSAEIIAGEPATERGAYKLSRAAETHSRFLESYRPVLTGETLPGLWRISQGLFARDMGPDWMQLELSRILDGDAARSMDRLAQALLVDFQAFAGDLTRVLELVERFRAADLALLAALKAVLQRGVRAFEVHQQRTRQCGARELRAACVELVAVFEHASEQLARDVGRQLETQIEAAAHAKLEAAAQPSGVRGEPSSHAVTRRLYTSAHWILDEHPAENLTVLQRTPVPWASLNELRAENATILLVLRSDRSQSGLLVDMRHAPIRNDADFESAMATLRAGLTGHFERTAVLLDTKLGELQVTRIERDERRGTLATRSESAALKFISGGK